MFCHPFVAPANKGADRRRRRVEYVDPIFFDYLPKSIGRGPVWRAFVHNHRGAIREWTVHNITVASDPADIGGAPKNVFIANVEDIFHRGIDAHQITTGGV